MSNSITLTTLKTHSPLDYGRIELHTAEVGNLPPCDEYHTFGGGKGRRKLKVADIPLTPLLEIQLIEQQITHLLADVSGYQTLRVVYNNEGEFKKGVGYEAEQEFFKNAPQAPAELVFRVWGNRYPQNVTHQIFATPYLFWVMLGIEDVEADAILWERERCREKGYIDRVWLTDVKGNNNSRYIKAENGTNFRGARFDKCSWYNAERLGIPYLLHHYLRNNNTNMPNVKWLEKVFSAESMRLRWDDICMHNPSLKIQNGHDHQTHYGTMSVA